MQPNARAAAAQLGTLFGQDVKIAALTPAIAPFAQQAGNPLTVVVVGTTSTGNLIVPTPPAPAPVQQPPSVTSNPGLTLASLQDARARKLLHFTPMVPHDDRQRVDALVARRASTSTSPPRTRGPWC